MVSACMITWTFIWMSSVDVRGNFYVPRFPTQQACEYMRTETEKLFYSGKKDRTFCVETCK
jgi:hypothetical protein